MNEVQRQKYLGLLGIQPVYLRFPVPGAAPSPVYRWPQSPAAVARGSAAGREPPAAGGKAAGTAGTAGERTGGKTTGEKTSSAMARALAAAGAGKALAATDKASAATNKSPPPAAVTDSAPAASEAPAPGPPMVFKLAWYHLNERLTVIQEFPAPRSGPDAASSELLQAILRALEDAALPQTLPQPEIFEWPLAQKADGGGLFGALAPMDDPRQAAREALGGFIRRRLERGPMQELLVFSEQLGPLLQDSPEAAPLSLTVTRGLDRVQAERALKREVWNALQPLKRRLQQSLQPGLQPGLQQSPDA